MKKVLSLVLALALVLSLCVNASAEDKVTLSFFDKNSGTRTFDDPVALALMERTGVNIDLEA